MIERRGAEATRILQGQSPFASFMACKVPFSKHLTQGEIPDLLVDSTCRDCYIFGKTDLLMRTWALQPVKANPTS